MKVFMVVLSVCIAMACAAPSAQELRSAPALEHQEIHDKHGQFDMRFVTVDGTIVTMRGKLIPGSEEGLVMAYEGENSYIGPDGHRYITKYTAGPNGFIASGDHLPKAPEVPVA